MRFQHNQPKLRRRQNSDIRRGCDSRFGLLDVELTCQLRRTIQNGICVAGVNPDADPAAAARPQRPTDDRFDVVGRWWSRRFGGALSVRL